jgi:uncharacterized protein
MAFHILIDGYNLIRQSNTLSTLENEDMLSGRNALIDMLASYKKIKRHRITVVFDGENAPVLAPHRDRLKGIDMIFSRKGETADSVIKRLCKKEKENALVVSSDREIVNYAVLQGAGTIGSQDFEKKVGQSLYASGIGVTAENSEKMPWDGSTKKKGPARRRSKKDRQKRSIFAKL